jgi:hypothetical protein
MEQETIIARSNDTILDSERPTPDSAPHPSSLNTTITAPTDQAINHLIHLNVLLATVNKIIKEAVVSGSPERVNSGFEMIELAYRYIASHEREHAVHYVTKYGTDLPAVFAVLAFPEHLDRAMILGACNPSSTFVATLPDNCHTFISTLPDDPEAWNRFVERERLYAAPLVKVVRLLSLINPNHAEDTEMFDPIEILSEIPLYASLYDHLGDITVSFMLDGVQAARSALAHIEFFDQAAVIIWDDARFSPEEKREALFFFPHSRIDEPGVQENLLSLLRTFGADATHCYLAVREADDAALAAMQCVAMDRALKGNSIAIFRAYDEDALAVYELHWPFLQGMLHRLEAAGEVRQCARIFQICCEKSLIPRFGNDLLKAAESKELAPEIASIATVFNDLKKLDCEKSSSLVPKVIELCRVCPTMFPKLMNGLEGTSYNRINKHFSFIKSVFQRDIHHASETLKAISWEEYESSPTLFEGMVETWKQSMWGIIRAYKRSGAANMGDFLNDYGREAVAIRNAARSGSGKLFSLIAAEEWELLGLPYAELFGESAGWAYSRAMHRKKETPELIPEPRWLLESQRFLDLYAENKKHMGIIHAERYLDPKIVIHETIDKKAQDRLLRRFEENLRCLDPDYKCDRKLAVVVLPHYDNNAAFRHQAHSQYTQLNALGYKVVLCESSTGQGALNAVRTVVERHRGCGGEVAKGAHYVALLAHANYDFSAWGDPETRDGDSHLSRDLEESLRIRDILSPDNAVLNIGGCLVGKGGTRSKNLGKIIRDWNQGITLLANPDCYALSRFVLDESGQKIIGLREGGATDGNGESQATRFFI